MPNTSRIFLVLFVLLSCFSSGNVLAQTVDPCGYGCPKEGCPECDDGGGPIEQQSDDNAGSQTSAMTVEDEQPEAEEEEQERSMQRGFNY